MSFGRTVWVALSPGYPLPPASRISKVSPWWSIIFLVFVFAVTATAQEATKDLGDASLEELGSIQVYSASKHMQSTSEAPASVTVVTADEIQKLSLIHI